MYTVSVRRHFDAAHALRGYAGKCERRHGHRFEVVVSVQRCQLDSIGLALDYGIIKRELDSVLALLDHTDLNETPPFDEINPSSSISRPISMIRWPHAWVGPSTRCRYTSLPTPG